MVILFQMEFGLDTLLSKEGGYSADDFDPQYHKEMYDYIQNASILVVGAGGLGCEILKNLAMTGFCNIHVIDMDTIDLSNLNRQFLFREADIGKPKATIASEYIMRMCPTVRVTSHFKRIQDLDSQTYQEFKLVICGLDSIEARKWMNSKVCSMVTFDENGEVNPESVIPLLDGGSEGFKGNTNIVMPGFGPCIECNMDLYPPQVNFPLCTLAVTPRLPEHCIEYIRHIWPDKWPFGENIGIDGDNTDHITWIYEQSKARAKEFNISGVTRRLTLGVIKRIIPAVASTNAVISAMLVSDALKIITGMYEGKKHPISGEPYAQNFTMFTNFNGVYCGSFDTERKSDCPVCPRPPVSISVPNHSTINHLLKELTTQFKLKEPSLTFPEPHGPVYIPGVGDMEANLTLPVTNFMKKNGDAFAASQDGCITIMVDDSTRQRSLIVNVTVV